MKFQLSLNDAQFVTSYDWRKYLKLSEEDLKTPFVDLEITNDNILKILKILKKEEFLVNKINFRNGYDCSLINETIYYKVFNNPGYLYWTDLSYNIQHNSLVFTLGRGRNNINWVLKIDD